MKGWWERGGEHPTGTFEIELGGTMELARGDPPDGRPKDLEETHAYQVHTALRVFETTL